jgi:hypothetical protein
MRIDERVPGFGVGWDVKCISSRVERTLEFWLYGSAIAIATKSKNAMHLP